LGRKAQFNPEQRRPPQEDDEQNDPTVNVPLMGVGVVVGLGDTVSVCVGVGVLVAVGVCVRFPERVGVDVGVWVGGLVGLGVCRRACVVVGVGVVVMIGGPGVRVCLIACNKASAPVGPVAGGGVGQAADDAISWTGRNAVPSTLLWVRISPVRMSVMRISAATSVLPETKSQWPWPMGQASSVSTTISALSGSLNQK